MTGRKLLTAAQYADRLTVSRKTPYSYAKRGFGPQPIRVGGRLAWFEDEVEAFIEQLAAQRGAA